MKNTLYMDRWLESYPAQPTESLVTVGFLKPTVLANLQQLLGNLKEEDYLVFDVKSNAVGVSGVGLYVAYGDTAKWNQHYDPNGSLINSTNNSPTKDLKSARNYPDPAPTQFSNESWYNLYSSFTGFKRAVLQKMKVNYSITLHSDSVDQERKRVHVVLDNQDVDYWFEETKVEMKIGGIYWFNGFTQHRVENNSNHNRTNLIVDCWTAGDYQDFVATSYKALKAKDLVV